MDSRAAHHTKPGTPKLAIFARHTLLDGRPVGYAGPVGASLSNPAFGAWPYNMGDAFVGVALARALKVDEFYTLCRESTQAEFDIVNSECSAIIMVAQNALHPGFFSTHLPVSYLKKIKIPMLLLSLGVQFQFGDKVELLPEDIESLKCLHDMCESSQVRGNISAELLASYGIKNTRTLACPALLHDLKPQIKIQPPSYQNTGFTITDMGARPAVHDWQFEIMENLFRRADNFSLIAQGGEVVLQDHVMARDGLSFSQREDFLIHTDQGKPVEKPRLEITNKLSGPTLMKSRVSYADLEKLEETVRWYYRKCSDELVDNIVERSFFSPYLHEYLRHAKGLDLIAGTRLHGNLMALAQGVPAVFAMHDMRLKEMAEFMEVPRISFENGETSFEIEELDWGPFERKHAEIYQGYKVFFEENGLVHRL